MPKSNNVSKKNFEIFAKGVERLKELEQELNSLESKGFYKEEQYIRTKLKNVSEIPNIERALRDLKLKIRKKYKPSRKKNPFRKFGKDLVEIKEEIPKIKNKFKDDLKDVKKEIPRLKNKIRDVKEVKEQIPRIQSNVKELSKKFDEFITKNKVRVDSGLSITVDKDFNYFLNNIKDELNSRVRNREKELHDNLEKALLESEVKYKKLHNDLIFDYNKKRRNLEEQLRNKYRTKVKTTLHKEVHAKFNKLLKRKKVELSDRYKRILREHAQKELELNRRQLSDRLHREFLTKIREIKIDEEKEKKKLIEEREKLEREEGIDIRKLKKQLTVLEAKKRVEDRLKEELKIKTGRIDKREKYLDEEREKIKKHMLIERSKLVEELKEREKMLNERKKELENSNSILRKRNEELYSGKLRMLELRRQKLAKESSLRNQRISKEDDLRLKKLTRELNAEKEKLNREIELKRQKLAKETENKKERLSRWFNARLRAREFLNKQRIKRIKEGTMKELTEKEMALNEERKKLFNERKKLEQNYRLLSFIKLKETEQTKGKLENFFISRLRREKNNKEQTIKRIKSKLVSEFHQKLNTELENKEKQLRSELKKEFDLNLRNKIMEHDEQLKKEKLKLEGEIQRKLKNILK